jgi:enoyl-CoA hydratase
MPVSIDDASSVRISRDGPVYIVTICRPEVRNAVDATTARLLFEAFVSFDRDPEASVAVLTGVGDAFCAGADLKAVAAGDRADLSAAWCAGSLAPMGPSRLSLSKPVIAAIEGPAVAGGLELALWADLRVAARTAYFGVYCRRFGVPLIDLGTIRLPRLIGQSRAMDLILTGRTVDAQEAFEIGLANRLVGPGEALGASIELARHLAQFPQACLRADRASVLAQWSLSDDQAIDNELRGGLRVIESGETIRGALAFTRGRGRHGAFE